MPAFTRGSIITKSLCEQVDYSVDPLIMIKKTIIIYIRFALDLDLSRTSLDFRHVFDEMTL
jgi:hypothetical protein